MNSSTGADCIETHDHLNELRHQEVKTLATCGVELLGCGNEVRAECFRMIIAFIEFTIFILVTITYNLGNSFVGTWFLHDFGFLIH